MDPLVQLAELVRGAADREAFDLLATQPALIGRLDADDYAVGAAVVREAAQRADATAPAVIDLVTRLSDHLALPATASLGADSASYVDALIAWYTAIQASEHITRLWDRIERLLKVDFGARVASRAHFLTLLAEIGLGIEIPPTIEAELIASADQGHLFHTDNRQALSLIAFRLERALRAGDRDILRGPCLLAWCRCFAGSRYTRRWGKLGRRPLMVLKDEIHARVARACAVSDLLLGRFVGLHRTLILLLIKVDRAIFGLTGTSTWLLAYPWYVVLRTALGRLARPRAPAASPGDMDRRLELVAPDQLEPMAGDLLVTRAQGGLGDVMTMRPGLLELARRHRGSRVIFATDPALFPAFSPDDALHLTDIRRLRHPPAAFDHWINLTNCPATRVEVAERPKVRTNRVKIFADALGIRDLDYRRLPPLRFEPSIDASAEAILRRFAPPGTPTVGIQLRSAETYKDVPILIEAARALATDHRVFLFDSRPIPRRADDGFIAIDDQPLPVALALASKLDVLVMPDSSFLHLAGMNRIRALGLFGPTDGKVRCAPYATVQALDLRAEYGCIPCWRRQDVMCRVTDGPESLCLRRISVAEIVNFVATVLPRTA